MYMAFPMWDCKSIISSKVEAVHQCPSAADLTTLIRSGDPSVGPFDRINDNKYTELAMQHELFCTGLLGSSRANCKMYPTVGKTDTSVATATSPSSPPMAHAYIPTDRNISGNSACSKVTSLHQQQWLRRRGGVLNRLYGIPPPPQGRQTVHICVSFAQSSGYGTAGRVHTGYSDMPVVQARRACGDARACRPWAYPE
ncbi:uncharacterized protein P174DRAFT_452111 [Aspergillus novofumigatus IBT 16806]|uniref:Uncharacterized protein n=1 Tax=Aspergillus novofumigatus (strain IBT 16806) TaxID=1392255 RepID=A0A2I1C593_ASPN1|nr:uncharacterized protein P174DRAFT_452111 [Aspergillus novofumigatus IBT 16806]PKX92828.1 hypothetical protein P174DRAFT_452111 [Aspergillus novofumigatus IBT 16806]